MSLQRSTAVISIQPAEEAGLILDFFIPGLGGGWFQKLTHSFGISRNLKKLTHSPPPPSNLQDKITKKNYWKIPKSLILRIVFFKVSVRIQDFPENRIVLLKASGRTFFYNFRILFFHLPVALQHFPGELGGSVRPSVRPSARRGGPGGRSPPGKATNPH